MTMEKLSFDYDAKLNCQVAYVPVAIRADILKGLPL